eukprot:jgi/Mesen1/3819/ME000207S02826
MKAAAATTASFAGGGSVLHTFTTYWEGDADRSVFLWSKRAMFLLAIVTFIAVSKVTAPYGRHVKGGWGPSMGATLGWMVMESPPLFVMPVLFSLGQNSRQLVPLVMLALYQMHYINRALVYPIRARTAGKRMPVLVAALAFSYNVFNSYIQARQISHYGRYGATWHRDARFVLGLALFLVGFALNLWADSVLLSLRRKPPHQPRALNCVGPPSGSSPGGGPLDRATAKGNRASAGRTSVSSSASSSFSSSSPSFSSSVPSGRGVDGGPAAASSSSSYSVPRGGLYELVACPNYLGEMAEWLGWAALTWSDAGLAFFVYTVANLAPRAVAHRAWYCKKFADFPRARKALVPFLV